MNREFVMYEKNWEAGLETRGTNIALLPLMIQLISTIVKVVVVTQRRRSYRSRGDKRGAHARLRSAKTRFRTIKLSSLPFMYLVGFCDESCPSLVEHLKIHGLATTSNHLSSLQRRASQASRCTIAGSRDS